MARCASQQYCQGIIHPWQLVFITDSTSTPLQLYDAFKQRLPPATASRSDSPGTSVPTRGGSQLPDGKFGDIDFAVKIVSHSRKIVLQAVYQSLPSGRQRIKNSFFSFC